MSYDVSLVNRVSFLTCPPSLLTFLLTSFDPLYT